MIRLSLETPPANKPMSMDLLKKTMRLDPAETEEDDVLSMWLDSGVSVVEEMSNRKLITQKWKMYADEWGEIIGVMPYGVCQSIEKIEYVDTDNQTIILDESFYGLAGSGNDYAKIWFTCDFNYPEINYTPESITVYFTCGYGDDESKVPNVAHVAISLYVQGIRNDDDVESALNAHINQLAYHGGPDA